MEFKQITIRNFLSYYGENEIEFSPMTTIFIGQNNTGKSKFFDAINFVLYARVYDTQNEAWETDDEKISKLILNKHKINEALNNEEPIIEVSVCLVVDDAGSQNILLNIERIFTFRLQNGSYVFASKSLNLSEIDKFDGSSKSYIGSEAIDRIRLYYFSDAIKDFFLFQGEAASKIMNLQKNGSFKRAVKEIARLGLFEKAKEYAEKYESTVNRSITIKQTKNEKKRKEHESLQKEIDVLNADLQKAQKDSTEAEKNIAEYRSILEKNEAELSELKEFEDYFRDKETLEKNRKNIQSELKLISSEKSSIAEESVFYKVRSKIKSFKDFYSKLEKKGEVPPSIPQFEIRKALDCCRCTICNTELSEGSAARNFAESRLSHSDTDKLGNYLRSLNYTIGDMGDDVEKVQKNLTDMIERKRNLETRKSALIKDDEELASRLENVKVNEKTSTEKKKRIEEVRNTVKRYSFNLRRAEQDKSAADSRIQYINDKIEAKNRELGNFVFDDDDVDIEDKIKLHYAAKLNAVMKRLFEVANTTAYAKVEETANEYYHEMTEENAALVGDIKIDLNNSEICTVDENGNRILNLNQGNII